MAHIRIFLTASSSGAVIIFQSSGGESVDSVELLDSGVLGLGRIGSGGGF